MPITELQAGRFMPMLGNGSVLPARATGIGSVAVDQVAPARMEASRAGRRFMLTNKGVTGQPPVQAWPTTAAQWGIWNTDPKKSYVFEEIGMLLTSGTPGVGGALLVALYVAPALTSGAGSLTYMNASATSAIGSNVLANSAQTLTSGSKGSPSWYVIATNSSPNVTAFAGSTFLENRSLQGGIIVPPSSGLALNVLAPAGTSPLFAPFATWVELELDLE